MDIYFTLWVMDQYYFIMLLKLFQLAPMSLCHTHIRVRLFVCV